LGLFSKNTDLQKPYQYNKNAILQKFIFYKFLRILADFADLLSLCGFSLGFVFCVFDYIKTYIKRYKYHLIIYLEISFSGFFACCWWAFLYQN
jgi:hypothetical protein